MHYFALAVDYDNTLADHGKVLDSTLNALRRLKDSGRRLVLVTGRCLEPLLADFPEIAICDLVVAENGALLYDPATEKRTPLEEPTPEEFYEALASRGVPPLERGHVIASSYVPHETTILHTIRDMGLELQIIFNKGAVMILPTGINKATGLREALRILGLSPHNTVGVGDAENDEAFLDLCGLSAAVENSLESVKKKAKIHLTEPCGRGVSRLIEDLLIGDLQEESVQFTQDMPIGIDFYGNEVRLPVFQGRILITGNSGGGKTKFSHSLMEQLIQRHFQIVVIDPEGDHEDIDNTLYLGNRDQSPTVEDILHLLSDPTKSCVASPFALSGDEKPKMFEELLHAIVRKRSQTGRPHWVLLDEAHHMLPGTYEPFRDVDLEGFRCVAYITPFPEKLPMSVLASLDTVISLGSDPAEFVEKVLHLRHASFQLSIGAPPQADRLGLLWETSSERTVWFKPTFTESTHLRHRQMYLEGDMEPADRFYFRGPRGELNIPAQNLKVFMQIAEGVDEDTWEFHLGRGDYSRWFEEKIQDEELAGFTNIIGRSKDLSAKESRDQVLRRIRERYERIA